MTFDEALKIIKNEYKDKSIIECLEFDEFYAFAIVEPGQEEEDIGGGYTTVIKSDGKISTFNPIRDLKALAKAKRIEL